MILPLPVKKNKYGDRVADISVEDYYRQINEEVLEAFQQMTIFAENNIIYDGNTDDNETEEVVDVITCAVTRLDIIHWFEDDEDFGEYLSKVYADAEKNYEKPIDFYTTLANSVMKAYGAAKLSEVVNILHTEGCGTCIGYFDTYDYDEESRLADIIVLCVKYLEQLGYDADARQKLYQAVNEKNRKRGYLEE